MRGSLAQAEKYTLERSYLLSDRVDLAPGGWKALIGEFRSESIGAELVAMEATAGTTIWNPSRQ